MRVSYAPALLRGSFGGCPAPAVMRQADPASLHTLHGRAMGTTWSARLGNPQFLPLDDIRATIDAALALVVRQMSNWESDSNISRFNRSAAGTWHTLPPECFTVLSCALDWASESGGAWDPTIGPLVQLWGFGPAAENATPRTDSTRVPAAPVLARAKACVDYRRIALRPRERQALQPGDAQLDLCGIAKGYSVDLAADALRALGLTDFLLEVGGELRACGKRPDGLPWRVAIRGGNTQEDAAPLRVLNVHDRAVATSGDCWHAFDVNGRRYSHTVDPRSGEPVAHTLASVTVLHAQCMHADALATVLTVLGVEQALNFATARDVAALLCERTPAGLLVHTTAAFDALAG